MLKNIINTLKLLGELTRMGLVLILIILSQKLYDMSDRHYRYKCYDIDNVYIRKMSYHYHWSMTVLCEKLSYVLCDWSNKL